MSWIAESRQSQIRRETDQPFPNSMRRADALSVFTNRPGISIMDNLSVFFLAEHEQSAYDVMARLAAFIQGAKQTLDFAKLRHALQRFAARATGGGIARKSR